MHPKNLSFLPIIMALAIAINLCPAIEAADVPISDATFDCLACHTDTHPGIVSDWEKSRHGIITPEAAMAVKGAARKISSTEITPDLGKSVVGCAECHTLRPKAHKDTFEHNGYDIHIAVSPEDCAACHKDEADQYAKNIMSHAYGNLAENPVYQQLEDSINGQIVRKDHSIEFKPADPATKAQTCYHCHGTKLEVTGQETRDTEIAGELTFPVINGWPNQGVGRINLDGSKGACTSCHPRHTFSMEMARKPYTCQQCHIGPDVPAYKVYTASKHGNVFSSLGKNWNFTSVPWTVGKDFSAPTCAACHISLVENENTGIVVKRTHQMNDRLPWRIFGLIYAHPHPTDPDTTKITHASGLPLPTDLDGRIAAKDLIDPSEQTKRRNTMLALCINCHDTSWANTFWQRFEDSIEKTNADVCAATNIMEDIWQKGHARGLDKNQNPFDEAIEKKWTDIWQFYANSIRFSSAMGGGGDYSVYAGGHYQLSQSILELEDWLKTQDKMKN